MIQGTVNDAYEAVVPLIVQGPSGQTRDLHAVLDTGFSDFLTLPPALVTELGLPYRNRDSAIPADGSEATFDLYRVTVLWDGHPRHVDAYAADTTPLVGMRLLDSQSLYVEVENGGRVFIDAMQEPAR